jgi:hypothetical protein
MTKGAELNDQSLKHMDVHSELAMDSFGMTDDELDDPFLARECRSMIWLGDSWNLCENQLCGSRNKDADEKDDVTKHSLADCH